ncbi:energy transducer TonB [Burkholderia sp. LMG 32019]|uniref:energy transducer TonB n=1 Tax=Burkholderia sp. LMG 32019 TaxID=3158173 RepID=UPI003C30DA18
MGLLDNLLGKAIGPGTAPRRVVVRVLLDDQGRVQDVVLKRSCGDPAEDKRVMWEVCGMEFPRGNLGSGPKTARRWHELNFPIK